MTCTPLRIAAILRSGFTRRFLSSGLLRALSHCRVLYKYYSQLLLIKRHNPFLACAEARTTNPTFSKSTRATHSHKPDSSLNHAIPKFGTLVAFKIGESTLAFPER